MQLRFATTLTSEQYISQEAWRNATLELCPLHGEQDCGLRVHGSYERKAPTGLRIARYYCRKGQTTFSLLPDFAAARLSGTLVDVEQAIEVAESASTLVAAARALRPELADERSAVRWLRRRVQAVQTALLALVTSLPGLFGTAPRLGAVRVHLGVDGHVLLIRLRAVGAAMLHALQAPLGLYPRKRARADGESQQQHKTGPDPGGCCR
jgi:hypothetical protein